MKANTIIEFIGLAESDISVTTSHGRIGSDPRYHVRVKAWDTEVSFTGRAADLRTFLASVEAEIARAEQREARAVA